MPSLASATPRSDFNGDGFPDLAVGIPFKRLAGTLNEGAVGVLYGGPGGLSTAGSQSFSGQTPGLVATRTHADSFGFSVAAADFNHDGFGDLAIGSPSTKVNGKVDAGAVYIIYGSPTGLRPSTADVIDEATPGIRTRASVSEQFGRTLAVGKLEGDRHVDLAIGAAVEISHHPHAHPGAVHVIPGSGHGLDPTGDVLLEDLAGGVDAIDQGFYGAALAVGDLNADGAQDLAVGAPRREGEQGAVDVFYQHKRRLSLAHHKLISPSSPRLRDDGPTELTEFGWSLAAGHLNRGSAADLAIGAPYTNLDDGAVYVLYGSHHGVPAGGDQYLSESTLGLQNGSHPEDGRFGDSLVAGEFGGDGRDDLAIGAPTESGPQSISGVVHVLYGASNQLTLTGNRLFTESDPGFADGGAMKGDELGASLGTGDFDADGSPELVVGKAELGDDDLGCHNAGGGAIHVLSSSGGQLVTDPNQEFDQNTPGMVGGGSDPCDVFGGALASSLVP